VCWTDLPEKVHSSLESFVQARLLVSSGSGDERELEVAHEALFTCWPVLREWIRESRSFLAWRKRIDPQVKR